MSLIIPAILFFYLVIKRLMKTKDFVVKIQNLIVNRESWPVKLNPESILSINFADEPTKFACFCVYRTK